MLWSGADGISMVDKGMVNMARYKKLWDDGLPYL